MRTDAERNYNTEYARRRRAEQLAAANANASKCTALLARRTPCRTPLQSRFVNGETVPFCPTCDRKARGICIDCGTAPVDGTPRRSLRCTLCAKLAKQAQYRKYAERHPDRRRRREAKRLADPEKRARKATFAKLLRILKPSKVAAYKKADYERHREKRLAYHAKYREARLAERRAVELARYHGTLPPRTCLTCPTVLTGRAKKCDACKQAARRAARSATAVPLDLSAA